MIASLPENLAETTIEQFAEVGVITLHGVETAIAAISAAAACAGEPESTMPALALVGDTATSHLVDEHLAKQWLADYGLVSPTSRIVTSLQELDEATGFSHEFTPEQPSAWVLKVVGVAHKTEVGGVRLNLRNRAELHRAFLELTDLTVTVSAHESQVLLESYVEAPLAELIVGVTRDSTGLLLLTIGAGGVYAELFDDTEQLLLPTQPQAVLRALQTLKLAPVLNGYRGQPAANLETLVAAIMAINDYALAQRDCLLSLDINPLLITPTAAIAVDALIELIAEPLANVAAPMLPHATTRQVTTQTSL